VSNCGGCGQACSSANGSASCSLGSCNISCNANYGNCDGNARTNGCEVNLLTNTSNCGSCGHSCGGLPCNSGACQCAPTGSRAAFNSGNATTTGCWDPSYACSRDAYSWDGYGASFTFDGESITCSGSATCISHVGVTSYGVAGYCGAGFYVYCDSTYVGLINTYYMACTGSAMSNGCSISFSPLTCSSVKLVATSAYGYDSNCCYSYEEYYAPDAMITAISAW
jgi:hypothetical protein